MSAKEINLFAGVQTKRNRRDDGNKAYIQIIAPDLVINFDEQKIAEPVAKAIELTIRTNLLSGKCPDGRPLPRSAPATVKRREYRDKQFGRSVKVVKLTRGQRKGKSVLKWADYREVSEKARAEMEARANEAGAGAAGRGRNLIVGLVGGGRAWSSDVKRDNAYWRSMARQTEKAATNAVWNLKYRFRGMQIGTFDPRDGPNTLFGLESGMLAHSMKIVPRAPGFNIYFADNRTRLDKSGGSAVSRVFSRIGLLGQLGLQQPEIQDALRATASEILGYRAVKILRELVKAGKMVGQIGSEAEQIAEVAADT